MTGGEPTPASEGVLGQVLRALLGASNPSADAGEPAAPRSPEVSTIDLERLRDEPAASEPAAGEAPREPPSAGREDVRRLATTAVIAEEETPQGSQPERDGAGIDPRVLAELQHPTSEVRLEALRRLLKDPEGAPVVAVTARLRDPEPGIREAAVAVLEATGDERLLLALLDAMGDPSERVRLSVRRAILDRASPSLIELLQRELEVPARCAAAAALLAEMGLSDGVLEKMRRAEPATRRLIAEALEDAGTTRRLIDDLTDGRPDRRSTAAERLGVIRAREAVDPLMERLEDPDRGVRIKAAEALGRIADPRTVHALKRSLVWDPDAGVAVAVGQAIRRIAGGGGSRTVRV